MICCWYKKRCVCCLQVGYGDPSAQAAGNYAGRHQGLGLTERSERCGRMPTARYSQPSSLHHSRPEACTEFPPPHLLMHNGSRIEGPKINVVVPSACLNCRS